MAPTKLQVTQADLDSLSTKLDEFSAVLTEREHALLVGIMALSGRELDDIIEQVKNKPTGGSPSKPTSSQLPSLSNALKDAFDQGVGTTFEIAEDDADIELTKVKNKTEVEWTM